MALLANTVWRKETQARGVVDPSAKPKAYEKSNPKRKPTKLRKRNRANGQAGKAGPFAFDGNGEAAGKRSKNEKPALPRLDLWAGPEARALAGL